MPRLAIETEERDTDTVAPRPAMGVDGDDVGRKERAVLERDDRFHELAERKAGRRRFHEQTAVAHVSRRKCERNTTPKQGDANQGSVASIAAMFNAHGTRDESGLVHTGGAR
jgi:hypothetical protein